MEELIGKRPFEEKKILEVETEVAAEPVTETVSSVPAEQAGDNDTATDSTVIA